MSLTLNDRTVKDLLMRLGNLTEGEPRTMLEVLSFQLGFGHISKITLTPDELAPKDKPTKRQIVFNWMMNDDLTKTDGWWGNWDDLVRVDELLAALEEADGRAN